MSYSFDQSIDRNGTASQKWERYRDQDILPMWVADTDFMAPPAVLDALHARINHGIFGYTNTPQELNLAVQAHLRTQYHWEIDTDWLVWLPGLVCGLNLACRAVGKPGDQVLTPTPVYPPFISAPQLSDRRVCQVPMHYRDNRLVLDMAALQAAIRPDTALLLLCNPHNPGGSVYRQAELEQLAAIAEQHDLIICSDEIHCDLLLQPEREHIPLARLNPSIAARTITLMAPSKTFNIAGLGCSFAVISDKQLRRRFNEVRRGIVPDVNLLGYTAALAAYTEGEDWHRQQLAYLRANHAYLLEAINQMPGLRMAPLEATYLAWIDVSGAGLDNPHHFFEQAGVGLSPGRDFGDSQFVRLNFGCTRERLEQAVERMRRALANHLPA